MFASLLLASSVTVTLPPTADVRGTEVALGEFATVTSEDASLATRLEEYDLGYAPAPGFSRLFDAARLERKLELHFPGVDVVFKGSTACRIVPATETVPGNSIVEIARRELLRMTAGEDVVFDTTRNVADQVIPAGNVEFDLRVRTDGLRVNPGANSVPVEILVDGGVYQTVWTNWKFEFWQKVPVLLRDVSAGEDITQDMIEYRRVSSVKTGTQQPLQRTALVSSRSLRALRKGDVLRSSDLARKELIRRGDVVTLEVKKGGVYARVAAIADEDGYMGSRIRVVLVETKRELTAVVKDRELVQIDMTNDR